MARKLKTYLTSLGFFDLAIAAPSMKAALEAWGSRSNLFHQGMAKEVDDPEVVAATMAKPGAILKRPIGSGGPFREHADLPTHLSGDGSASRARKSGARSGNPPPRKSDDKSTRELARAFDREQRRREGESQKEEAAAAKLRERRRHAIAQAEAALDRARREHERRAAAIESEHAALEKRAQAEEARWETQKDKLADALRSARD